MLRTVPPSTPRGFTLIELLTVMAVAAILAGLVLSIQSIPQTKPGRGRAEAEIRAMILGAENYKGDNGTYPRNADTDALNPRKDGAPRGSDSNAYQKASLYLYTALSGDAKPAGAPDGKPEPENKAYLSADFFKPAILGGKKDADGKLLEVKYLQDPFGNSYGYSTMGAKAEQDFQTELRTHPNLARPKEMPGYNPTFDLWSTGGSAKGAGPSEQAAWVKNW
ncbi:MAG: hypothetical protein QOE70_3494 [Chthoniobacter sp.]|jgi:prepilin-type N-terminal cleavage/methylation domain-containing protein|nr:hypothetical protein [Chthoniobacter sp.]